MTSHDKQNVGKDIRILFGPGRSFIIIGSISAILLILIEYFGGDSVKQILDQFNVFSFDLLAQAFKLSIYSILLGLIINSFIPRLKNLISDNVSLLIEESLIPPIKDINKSVSKDLEALKRKSIPLLLQKASKKTKIKAIRSTIKSKYGSWHGHRSNFIRLCLDMVEKDSSTPYLRENNIKDIKVEQSDVTGFLKWTESNTYRIRVDKRALKKDNLEYKFPVQSTIVIENTKKNLEQVFTNAFNLEFKVENESEELETVLHISKNDFSYNATDKRIVVNDGSKDKLILISELRGKYISMTLKLTVTIPIKKIVTSVCVNEVTLLDKSDNIYTLTTSTPFLGGTIIFEVPKEYNITFHKLCPSTRWQPISTTETNNGSAIRKISSSTTKWVLPGVYFIAKWDSIK